MIGESRAEGPSAPRATTTTAHSAWRNGNFLRAGSGEKESFETKKDSLRFGSYVGVSNSRSFVNEYWLNSYFQILRLTELPAKAKIKKKERNP